MGTLRFVAQRRTWLTSSVLRAKTTASGTRLANQRSAACAAQTCGSVLTTSAPSRRANSRNGAMERLASAAEQPAEEAARLLRRSHRPLDTRSGCFLHAGRLVALPLRIGGREFLLGHSL